MLFFQSGFEGASGNFTVSFLDKAVGMDNAAATLSMTWFTIGMMSGRLPLGFIMKRLKDLGTLYLYLIVALIGVLLFYIFSNEAVVVYVAMVLLGFGVGATYPVVLNYIGGVFRELSGTAFSIAIFIALCGQSVFNKLTGIAFDNGNYQLLPVVLILAVLAMMVLVPFAVAVAKKMSK